MSSLRGLEGRVALITGGGRGIGSSIASRLASEGCKVVVNDRDADLARRAADEITRSGGAAGDVGGSVTDPADTESMVGAAAELFGGLDIVVNNAGLTADGWLHRMSDETWDLVVDVCLNGTFNVCRSAARLLRKDAREIRHHRKVVNIVSINGIYGAAANVNYSAAKSGVIGITKSLAREWAGQKINVNAIAPGYIKGTRLSGPRDDAGRFGIAAELIPKIEAQIPIGRPGLPEDVAAAVAFLSSSESDYVTGQVLEVHGGLEGIQLV